MKSENSDPTCNRPPCVLVNACNSTAFDESGELGEKDSPVVSETYCGRGVSDCRNPDSFHMHQQEMIEGYAVYNGYHPPQVWDVAIQRAYMHLGELMWFRSLQSEVPPPPPPPPPIQYCSVACQTEILNGDMDGMGRRLQVYRNHIQALRHKVDLRSSWLAKVKQEVEDSLQALAREAQERERDNEAHERQLAALRDEQISLAEKLQVQNLHLQERDALLQLYKSEIQSLELRLKSSSTAN